MTKSTPRIACTHFQPVVETVISMNSLTPAMMATMPNRYEIADDRDVVPLEHDQREDEPADPGDQEDPPAVGGVLENLAGNEYLVHRSSLSDCAIGGAILPGLRGLLPYDPPR